MKDSSAGELQKLDGVNYLYTTVGAGLGGPKAPLQVEIRGPDGRVLLQISDQVSPSSGGLRRFSAAGGGD